MAGLVSQLSRGDQQVQENLLMLGQVWEANPFLNIFSEFLLRGCTICKRTSQINPILLIPRYG